MRKKQQRGYVYWIPQFPERCADCNRTMDSRVASPFGPWAIPTMDGATGKTRCTYCHDLHKGEDPRASLPAESKALQQLFLWLDQDVR